MVFKCFLLDSKNKFEYFQLLICLLFEQNKIKEAVSFMKYVKEKYQHMGRELIVLLQMLMNTFMDDSLKVYTREKMQFLFEEKKTQGNPKDYYFTFFESSNQRLFDPESIKD